jgi:hypothetical protein
MPKVTVSTNHESWLISRAGVEAEENVEVEGETMPNAPDQLEGIVAAIDNNCRMFILSPDLSLGLMHFHRSAVHERANLQASR